MKFTLKNIIYPTILLVMISFGAILNGQERQNMDYYSIPLIANCEDGYTIAGRKMCINNAISSIVNYIDTDEVLGRDLSQRVYVKLEFKVSEIGDIYLENVEHDDEEIKRIINKAFNIWKISNKFKVVKPAQKNGQNISVTIFLPLVFYGAEY